MLRRHEEFAYLLGKFPRSHALHRREDGMWVVGVISGEGTGYITDIPLTASRAPIVALTRYFEEQERRNRKKKTTQPTVPGNPEPVGPEGYVAGGWKPPIPLDAVVPRPQRDGRRDLRELKKIIQESRLRNALKSDARGTKGTHTATRVTSKRTSRGPIKWHFRNGNKKRKPKRRASTSRRSGGSSKKRLR